MGELVVSFTTAVAAVVGVVQACKMAGFPKRFSALLSIFLSVAGASLFLLKTGLENWDMVLFNGVLIGLAAAGLYSSGKSILKS